MSTPEPEVITPNAARTRRRNITEMVDGVRVHLAAARESRDSGTVLGREDAEQHFIMAWVGRREVARARVRLNRAQVVKGSSMSPRAWARRQA